ncbi:hypothetical protein ZOSMA_8G01040 [Zostera marina]|uniref:Uncharacterized protein n=1 Tax=Zostera marina TaxID=29655 RepID=A0A0K9NK10_ZOSMR|nr:hypothetical protein ZOSMA_8G01040 [Zostera marina]
MVNISNSLILFFNSCSLFISIPISGAGIIFALNTSSECQGYLGFPFIISGTFILAMSVFGVVGSYFRSNVILCIYLTLLFVLISGLLTSTIFVFVVWSQEDNGYSSSGYSSYLKSVVSKKENWNRIQNCLKGEMMCRAYEHEGTAQYAYKANLTSIQYGCCRPPKQCGFIMKNATYWSVPKNGVISGNRDCNIWSNDQDKLCYECKSCKAGFLSDIHHQWQKIASLDVLLITLLIFVFIIGCCAIRKDPKAW